MKDNKWVRLLTYVTGLVNQELLLQNEYLAGGKPHLAGTVGDFSEKTVPNSSADSIR